PSSSTVPTPARTAASVASSNDNSNSAGSSRIPLASSISDQQTFGTTKMFSFLHPSRYQRSYGQVGLDFCCPNLDGPMQAIDPTRLHAKVEVPILELPQYMVISTKIISKQDKNIPQKVRAKLEQLAAKEGLPCAMQALQTLATPAPTATPSAAAASTAKATVPPAVRPVEAINERVSRPAAIAMPAMPAKLPRPMGESTASASDTDAAKSSPALLQLPPICPSDKLRVELQTRVQLFDMVLQRLARRAATMNASERQVVIENIVKTSTLLPVDVAVGTKLLENYVHHLNEATNIMTPHTSTPQASNTISSSSSSPNSLLAKALRSEATTRQAQQRLSVGVATTAADSRSKVNRPIYDSDKNIIGYQYAAPKLAVNGTPLAPGSSWSSARAGAGAGTGTALMAPAATQQAAFDKVTGNTATTAAGTKGMRAARRVGSGSTIPFNPSPAQRTYARSPPKPQARTAQSSSSLGLPATAASTTSNSNTYNTNINTNSTTTTADAAGKSSNRNPFILNQLLSQPEECILPDGLGSADATALNAEIKGEVDDTEILA
ncbi:hypothetical protein KR222_000233, partial [Zaprionus bogoriensis]